MTGGTRQVRMIVWRSNAVPSGFTGVRQPNNWSAYTS